MKVKKLPTWKDDWVQESKNPIAEMFYKCIGREPTKKELELYVSIVVLPGTKQSTKKKIKKLVKLIEKTNNEQTEGL